MNVLFLITLPAKIKCNILSQRIMASADIALPIPVNASMTNSGHLLSCLVILRRRLKPSPYRSR